jgi:putative tricarboxylic transport membrane protein
MLQDRLRRSAAYAVILCAAVYLYYVASHFQFEQVSGRIGPDAWPKIVLVLLLATCVWQIGRILVFGAAPTAGLDDELPVTAEGRDYLNLALIAIGVTVVYAYLLPILGFFVATVLYVVAISYVGRYRRLVPLAATSILAPLVLMFVFMRIVYIALPFGRGPFKDLSLVLLKILGVH